MTATKPPSLLWRLLAAACGWAAYHGTARLLDTWSSGWPVVYLPFFAPALCCGIVLGLALALRRGDAFEVIPTGLQASLLAYAGVAGSVLVGSARQGPAGAFGVISLVLGLLFFTAPLLLAGALASQSTVRLVQRPARSDSAPSA